MSTVIRPEVSESNKYWISKHRYYELKHFCLQYPAWKKAYAEIDGMMRRSNDIVMPTKNGEVSDPTADCVDELMFYKHRMCLVEEAAMKASTYMASYILKAVTSGVSYDYLKVNMNIPCGKDMYYEMYRRFYWILDKTRK